MNDILGKIREKASQLSSVAVEESNKLAFTVKTNFAISDRESEINKLYRETGKRVYDAYKGGGEFPTEEVAHLYSQIDILSAEITELREQLNNVKNVRVCPVCGASVDNSYEYCPKCGNKM